MTIADRNFIGMQLGPISLVDEGVDNLLDTMCERIGINVVFLSTVSWLGLKIGRSISWEIDGWPDHGIPESNQVEGGSYLKPRPQYYQNTFLDGFRAPDKIFEGKDALEMIIPGIRQRGMKIMPELMEPLFKYAGHGSSNTIPMANLPQCIEIDFLGRVASEPCLENPAYRKWWHGLFEDHCRNYDIDGIMWCNERRSPIDQLISGQLPTCFCKYCEASLRSEGVDMERVRTAVKNLYTYFSNLKAGIEMKDGTFIEFLRQLLANPEILLLERHWVKRNKDLDRELFGITKWCNPNLEFGLNVWNRNHLNPIRKAEWPWDEVKEYADWVKPITYQHQAGGIFVNEMSAFYETILRDASPSEWQPIIYQILGIKEGPFHELIATGMRPDTYVGGQCQATVKALDGELPVYMGVGVDAPRTSPQQAKCTPQIVYDSVTATYEAGGSGVIFSPNYSSMHLSNLDGAARALKDLGLR